MKYFVVFANGLIAECWAAQGIQWHWAEMIAGDRSTRRWCQSQKRKNLQIYVEGGAEPEVIEVAFTRAAETGIGVIPK